MSLARFHAAAAAPKSAHAYEIPVRYGDTDQMRVAYYANYLYWFEIARTEWLRAHGKSYRELEADGVILPVTEAHCRYLASARDRKNKKTAPTLTFVVPPPSWPKKSAPQLHTEPSSAAAIACR